MNFDKTMIKETPQLFPDVDRISYLHTYDSLLLIFWSISYMGDVAYFCLLHSIVNNIHKQE